MGFQRELHAQLGIGVQDGFPARGEFLITGVDHLVGCGRKAVDQMPYRAAGEAVDNIDAKCLGGAARIDHLLGAALAHAVGVAIAPQAVWQDGAVAFINGRVCHTLTDQVIADREVLQAVLRQQVFARLDVAIVSQRFVDFKVVAPACQLQPVIAEFGCFCGQGCDGQVCPLPGE